MTATYLYTPPTWRNVSHLAGPLIVGVRTSTCVYRRGGVWHNVSTAGEQDVSGIDVWVDPTDASNTLTLFFTGPTPVPASLVSALQALPAADPTWTPGAVSTEGPNPLWIDDGVGTLTEVTGLVIDDDSDGDVDVTATDDDSDGVVEL